MSRTASRRSSKPEGASETSVDHRDGALVPRRITLDGFAKDVAVTQGLDVREAEPLVAIRVSTRNSVYRIIPLRWGYSDVLVQGGQFFPEPTEARLVGSTFGGSVIKMHWISVGMHLEIASGAGERPVITTRVTGVSLERERALDPRPH